MGLRSPLSPLVAPAPLHQGGGKNGNGKTPIYLQVQRVGVGGLCLQKFPSRTCVRGMNHEVHCAVASFYPHTTFKVRLANQEAIL